MWQITRTVVSLGFPISRCSYFCRVLFGNSSTCATSLIRRRCYKFLWEQRYVDCLSPCFAMWFPCLSERPRTSFTTQDEGVFSGSGCFSTQINPSMMLYLNYLTRLLSFHSTLISQSLSIVIKYSILILKIHNASQNRRYNLRSQKLNFRVKGYPILNWHQSSCQYYRIKVEIQYLIMDREEKGCDACRSVFVGWQEFVGQRIANRIAILNITGHDFAHQRWNTFLVVIIIIFHSNFFLEAFSAPSFLLLEYSQIL